MLFLESLQSQPEHLRRDLQQNPRARRGTEPSAGVRVGAEGLQRRHPSHPTMHLCPFRRALVGPTRQEAFHDQRHLWLCSHQPHILPQRLLLL